MRKILMTFISVFLLSAFAFGQMQIERVNSKEKVNFAQNSNEQAFKLPAFKSKSVIFYEDFNGELPATWTTNTIQGPVDWEWTDVGGAYGGQLNSTTAANGYMIFDSDGAGTGDPEEANLITPAIDCSGVTDYIFFSVEHLARTYGNAEVRIYISTDDFDTETMLYEWAGAEQNAANGANPVVSLFNITQYAEGHTNVKIKFNWIGAFDYWWLIDDVTVFEAESYELTMEEPNGEGTVIPAPGVHEYVDGTVVNLSASPGFSYTFDSWTGNVANTALASTTIEIADNYTIKANFTEYAEDILWNQFNLGANANTSVSAGALNYEVADNFTNQDIDEIHKIIVHGVAMTHDGTAWTAWNPGDEEPFIVRFYDETVAPDWGAPVSEHNVSGKMYNTGESFNIGKIYKIELELDAPVALTEGWISVQIDVENGAGGWILLVRADEGDGDSQAKSYNHDASEGSDIEYDFMLELWGYASYKITFEIENEDGEALTDAIITFDGVQYGAGIYEFEDFAPGTYDYTVELEGYVPQSGSVNVVDGDVTETIVLLEINYEISLDLTEIDFGLESESYDPLTPKDVTVSNDGTVEVTNLSVAIGGENPGDFTITQPTETTLGVAETTVFTVVPKPDLAVGTYSATVTVSSTEADPVDFHVSFGVTDLPVYALSVEVNPAESGTISGVRNYIEGAAVTLTANPIEGYEFVNWTDFIGIVPTTDLTEGTTVDDAEIKFDMPANAVSLNANFTASTYTITYVLDGGENHQDNPDSFTIDDLPVVLREASKDGYVFEGWFAEDTFENQITEIDAIGSVTLYAEWSEATYIVTYNANNAETTGNVPVDDNDYLQGDIVTVLGQNTLELDGYTFTGWNTQEDGSGDTYLEDETFDMPAEDVVLYAMWDEETSINELNASINVYPNPSTGVFFIETDHQAQLEIIDISGRIIYKKLTQGKEQVLLQQKGMYILKVVREGTVELRKIIVQ